MCVIVNLIMVFRDRNTMEYGWVAISVSLCVPFGGVLYTNIAQWPSIQFQTIMHRLNLN